VYIRTNLSTSLDRKKVVSSEDICNLDRVKSGIAQSIPRRSLISTTITVAQTIDRLETDMSSITKSYWQKKCIPIEQTLYDLEELSPSFHPRSKMHHLPTFVAMMALLQ
jgi:hypothetical protein